MTIGNLRTNHIDRPLGFDMDSVRLSYVVQDSAGSRQEAARVVVTDRDGSVVFDTGKVDCSYDMETGELLEGIDNSCYVLPMKVMPRQRYYWRVCVWSDAGEMEWSPQTWFETARGKDEEWKGCFITPTFDSMIHPVFVRKFKVSGRIRYGRLYILGLGLYEVYLNGEKVGEEVLQPGLHAYDSWLQYQTCELNCREGENEILVMLGNGWYKGRYGLKKSMPRYGDRFALIAEIDLRYEDGGREVIATDSTWQVMESPIQSSGIYDGEVYDALQTSARLWPSERIEIDKNLLAPRKSPYLMIHERIEPTLVVEEPGYTILDMGQNMAGWVSFYGFMERGEELRMTFGEMMQGNDLYTDNLRTAKCEFRYRSDGRLREVRPHFTYFGFRYVKVERTSSRPVLAQEFKGCAIYSQVPQSGFLETANPKVNQLFSNILWSQKSNFLDIPTDCPQRDERMGWTGDAQVFAQTACFNCDCYAFYEKFSHDLYLEQCKCGGSVPYVVPMSGYYLSGACVWGDAATVIPWTVYQQYGDPHILEAQYDSMKDWVDYIRKETERTKGSLIWRTGRQFGDWLALDGAVRGGVYGATDHSLIATAYFWYSADIVGKTARILGREQDSERYGNLAQEVKRDFIREYYTLTGRLTVPTQTAYALCICLGLYPEQYFDRIASDFRNRVIHSRYLLETGFVGTPFLLPALSACGYQDLVFRILLHEEYPGWMYAVLMGATTVWERWNSVEPDGSMCTNGMNSLNHYAYGSVAGWMYQWMGGLKSDPETPGFKRALIAPLVEAGLGSCRVQYNSVNGEYVVMWKVDGSRVEFNIKVPFGCTAQFTLPDNVRAEDEERRRTLHAGQYQFTYPLAPPAVSKESLWEDVKNNTQVLAVMKKHFPRILSGIAFQEEQKTIDDIMRSPFSELDEEQIECISEELKGCGWDDSENDMQ